MRTEQKTRVKSRLAVEGLESRSCLSTTVTFSAGTLSIVGDGADNDVQVIINDNTNQLTVIADGVTTTYSSFDVKKLNVDLKGGDDDLWVGVAPGADIKFSKDMVLKLGDGENTAWLGFNDGIGGDVIIQGSLNIDVFGGGQKDDVIGHFGWKHGGYLKVNTYLGAGDDSAFINMWGDISGSADVSFYMSGGAGNDSLSTWNTFDNQDYAYGSVDVTGDSSLSIVMKGGIGEDTLGLTYAGEMDGDLYIRLEGGADADDISGEVFLQGTSHGQLDALFKGQGGNDTLNFDLHDNSGGNADILQALIDGGAGWDWGYKTGPVAKINCEPILIII